MAPTSKVYHLPRSLIPATPRAATHHTAGFDPRLHDGHLPPHHPPRALKPPPLPGTLSGIVRIITEQQINPGPGDLRTFKRSARSERVAADHVTGPVQDLSGQKTTRGTAREVKGALAYRSRHARHVTIIQNW